MLKTFAQAAADYCAAAEKRVRQSVPRLLLLGTLAGMFIAFAGVAASIGGALAGKIASAAIFPMGLTMVLLAGSELFTGNCLISISLLDRQCTLAGMLRNWAIVYVSNFAGALLVAAGCAWFGQMNYSGGQLAVFTMKLAAGKCTLPFQNAFVLAVLCNFLVCLGVIIAMTGTDTTGRILGAFLPVSYFVICGFEHCVANMYYIPAGLMAKAVPAYAQLAAESGLDLSALTVSNFVVKNLIPVTIGNILGGVILSLLMWFCYLRKKK